MGENRLMADLYEENQRLKARIEELESKHFVECTQIAQYSDENAKLKELLRKAVEDFPDLTDMWRYAVETLKLIGGAENDTL